MMETNAAQTFIMDGDELRGQRQDQGRFFLCLVRGAAQSWIFIGMVDRSLGQISRRTLGVSKT